MKVLVINGPNLARLDIRDSAVYGDLNYQQLKDFVISAGKELGIDVDMRQSDEEAEIIHWLHEAADSALPVIINPAAFTHLITSASPAAKSLFDKVSSQLRSTRTEIGE